MNECAEVAESMSNHFVGCVFYADYRNVVRRLMPDETEQVIDNVAWGAYISEYGQLGAQPTNGGNTL